MFLTRTFFFPSLPLPSHGLNNDDTVAYPTTKIIRSSLHSSTRFVSTDYRIPKPVIPGIGEPNWFLLTLLAPYAGIYYWRQGDRVDEVAIKLEANDDETENTIAIQGSEEEIERMWRTLEWSEKGMVKVPGLLEG